MSIPASVTNALAALQAQVSAALPLETASRPTIQAIQLNAASLVSQVDTALANAATLSKSGTLGVTATIDTWVAPVAPEDIITGVTSMLTSVIDQWKLAVMRGLVGRVASNLDQLGPIPAVKPTQIYIPAQPVSPI